MVIIQAKIHILATIILGSKERKYDSAVRFLLQIYQTFKHL